MQIEYNFQILIDAFPLSNQFFLHLISKSFFLKLNKSLMLSLASDTFLMTCDLLHISREKSKSKTASVKSYKTSINQNYLFNYRNK